MSDESKVFVLEDGRELGYGEWGVPDGLPVFFFHGTPGSRILTRAFDRAATDKGVRLIGVDRPGYGLSTFQENRTVLDYTKDIIQLADGLGIQRFGVMGASGGGPYAFACAYASQDRVFAGVAISSVGPPEAWNDVTRAALETTAQNPEQSEQQLAAFPEMVRNDRDGLIKNLLDTVPEAHRSIAESRPELLDAFLDHHVEGQIQGSRGTLQEQQLIMQPWGFGLESIRAPFGIWCGSNDLLADDARYLAEKLPNAKLHIEEGAGHLDGLWQTENLIDMLKSLVPESEVSQVK